VEVRGKGEEEAVKACVEGLREEAKKAVFGSGVVWWCGKGIEVGERGRESVSEGGRE
jgi:hypothetical protein